MLKFFNWLGEHMALREQELVSYWDALSEIVQIQARQIVEKNRAEDLRSRLAEIQLKEAVYSVDLSRMRDELCSI
jgi:hypothetical protein